MKKVLALLFAVSILLPAAAGCGRGGERLVVLLRGQEDELGAYRELIERYSGETGVEVELRTADDDGYDKVLQEALEGGELPDIFCAAPGEAAAYAEKGLILPLDGYIDGGAADDLWTALRDAYRFEDGSGESRLYALPRGFTVNMLAFNKDIFDAAGEPYPKPEEPYTWNEFLAVCQRLTRDTDKDGAIDMWGFAGGLPGSLDAFVYTNNASYLDGDGAEVNVESAEFVEALQFFADLTCKYQVAPPVSGGKEVGETGLQCWLEGRAAFYPCGTGDAAAFDGVTYGWGYCGWPVGASGRSTAVIEADGLAVSAATGDPVACAEIIRLLSTDPEGQKLLCGGPDGSAVRIPNIRSYAAGDFSEAIDTGGARYGDGYEIIFSCLDSAGRYRGIIPERDLTADGGWWGAFLDSGYPELLSGEVTAREYCEKAAPAMREALDGANEALTEGAEE